MASSYQYPREGNSSRVFDLTQGSSAGEHSCALPLTVLFTTVPDTLAALREAAHWAHQLGACIRILVPHVVPYPLPIEQPRVDPRFRLRHLRTICEHSSVMTYIEIRLCRDACQCVQEALLPHSLVVVGGRPSRWPFTYEKRLGRKLRNAGHQVVFADAAIR